MHVVFLLSWRLELNCYGPYFILSNNVRQQGTMLQVRDSEQLEFACAVCVVVMFELILFSWS
jgi:hypothetical protein